jgi:hypothetical protein
MFARLPLIALRAALATAPALAKDKTEFTCTGVFAMDSSEARVIETYGAENVVTGDVPGPEGTTMLATTAFPNDPEKSIQFVWWNEQDLTDPSYADLPDTMVGPKGARAGMTIAELVELNGEPFTLSGFGWDYGGFANIQKGELADLEGGCILSVRFAAGEYPEGVDDTSVMGDQEVSSDNPVLEELDVRVQSISVGYAHPDFRD